jgi:hypothetical protein
MSAAEQIRREAVGPLDWVNCPFRAVGCAHGLLLIAVFCFSFLFVFLPLFCWIVPSGGAPVN